MPFGDGGRGATSTVSDSVAMNRLPTHIDTSMPTPSFHEWLAHRLQQVPDATELALLIARSGAAGISREDLAKAVRLPEETIENLLRALVAAGQVRILKVNGQGVFRAAT